MSLLGATNLISLGVKKQCVVADTEYCYYIAGKDIISSQGAIVEYIRKIRK